MVKRPHSRRASVRTGEKERNLDNGKRRSHPPQSEDPPSERVSTEMHDHASEASRHPENGNDSIAPEEGVQESATDAPYSDIVFQCVKCHTVVGDTRAPHVVDLEHNILSLRAASNVRTDDKLHVCQSGFAAGCTFRRILCDNCGALVGRMYASTIAALDQYRSLYTLEYDCLDSYRLGSGKTPQGETIEGPSAPQSKPQRAGEEPRVSADDFIALDAYVTDVGKAVNKQTDALDQYGKALEELQKDFKDSENLMKDVRQSLEYAQNIILVWEERFRNFDTFKEKTNTLLEGFQARMENCQSLERKFMKLDANVGTMKDTVVRFDNMQRVITNLRAKVDGLNAKETRFDDHEPKMGDKIKGTFAPLPCNLPRNTRHRHQVSGRSSPKAKRRRN
ncbi:hypothetical protein FGB62_58g121 [Gracilaria domingensis]|nr:hypothetical protein FGB62_58g121 [Gracilaria domingensis]